LTRVQPTGFTVEVYIGVHYVHSRSGCHPRRVGWGH
jgi:hypothetical protein